MVSPGAGPYPEGTSPAPPRLPALDGLRAIAILGVVLVHLLGISGALRPGQHGLGAVAIWGLFGNVIDVFFILSGFLLFMPVVLRDGELGDRRRYALGRAARILPTYWATIALLLVLMLAWHQPLPTAGEIAIHLTALQTPARLFDGGIEIGFNVDGPLWMISILVGFYLVLPLVARSYWRHPIAGLAAAAVLTTAWKLLAPQLAAELASIQTNPIPIGNMELSLVNQLPGWAFSFAIGMSLAHLYVWAQRNDAWPTRASVGRAALAALPAYCLFAYLYGRAAAPVGDATAGSVARTDAWVGLGSTATRAALIAILLSAPAWAQRPFASPILARFGRASYGVYVIHIPVAFYLGLLVLEVAPGQGPATFPLWLAIVLPPSLAYGWACSRWLDEPAKRWARRLARRPSPAGTTAFAHDASMQEPFAGKESGPRG